MTTSHPCRHYHVTYYARASLTEAAAATAARWLSAGVSAVASAGPATGAASGAAAGAAKVVAKGTAACSISSSSMSARFGRGSPLSEARQIGHAPSSFGRHAWQIETKLPLEG